MRAVSAPADVSDLFRRDVARRIERAAEADAVAIAEQLVAAGGGWGTTVFALADGHAVLDGPGLYTNVALAVGLDGAITVDDLDVLERRAVEVGVPAAVEIVPIADPSVLRITAERGYALTALRTVLAMSLPDGRPTDATRPEIKIVRVADDASLALWQHVCAIGWGHARPAARRASDAFATATVAVPGTQLVLAVATDDGRPLGCAGVSICEGVATLGAMATHPDERGRGVQRALVHHRLGLAVAAGCDLATSSVVPGGASERNLARLGFTPLYTRPTVTRRSR